MAGTYTQIYVHFIFGVKHRQPLLHKSWREELYKYISGIIREKGQKPIIMGGIEDHIHVLVGLKPTVCLSDLIRDIKNNSSKYINERRLVRGKFQWQEGYGAFSCSTDHVRALYRYIENQEEHHAKKTFQKEYLEFLKAYEIEYNEKYLFD
ncbi:MAG: IS200/IS605 family transposase [Crocinitomicaceae bacterium]|jgi:REP element-mobilizing transposase RayT|nr:IS200/IS605 family transposase [Crocinitomicaceae bacterium]